MTAPVAEDNGEFAASPPNGEREGWMRPLRAEGPGSAPGFGDGTGGGQPLMKTGTRQAAANRRASSAVPTTDP
jgi:hypothetical protein